MMKLSDKHVAEMTVGQFKIHANVGWAEKNEYTYANVTIEINSNSGTDVIVVTPYMADILSKALKAVSELAASV